MFLPDTWRVIISSVELKVPALRLSRISVIGPGHQKYIMIITGPLGLVQVQWARQSCPINLYVCMKPQPATDGPASSVEAEEILFNSLAVDTRKLFLC